MSQWYYSKNGKAQGPVEEQEIETAIKAGEITPLDLVFQVGGEEWKPAAEVDTFESFFKSEEETPPSTSQIIEDPETVSDDKEKPEWVVLRKVKNDKGMQYKQMGPYTKEKVLQLLDSGEILFTDYGWKKGLESWIPIHKLEPFKAPLPSSVPVETQVYEDGDVENSKDAPKNDMTSLTELIEIEKFQREKTQVMSATQIREHWQDTTVTGMRKDPEPVADPSQLWSLEPPSEGQAAELKTQTNIDPVKQGQGLGVQSEPSSQPARRARVMASPPRGSNHPNLAPWIAAAGALVLSIVFVFSSFNDSSEEIEPEAVESVSFEKSKKATSPPPSQKIAEPTTSSEDESLAKIKKLQAKLEELRAKANDEDRKLASKKAKKKTSKKKSKKKKLQVKTKPKAKEKPKPKPKPVVKVKPKPKPVAKKAQKKKHSIPPAVRGSHRDKAYYLQRDRKILFYSSLEGERLVLELEANFRKLGKSKSKWKKFYGRWNRGAKNFPHPILRRFPERSRKYAFPRQFSSFKQDHETLLDYGRLYNAKVLGLRQPASPGKDMKKVFANYQEQARNLGRR